MSSEESKFAADFRLLLKIASNSKGNIEGTDVILTVPNFSI